MKALTLNKAHLLALAGNIATALVTFIPSWSGEHQIIAAALGGIVSNTYPLVNAVHVAIGVAKDLIATRPNLDELKVDAEDLVHEAVGKIDFDTIARNVQTEGLAAVPEMVRSELAKLLSAAVTSQPAPASPVTTSAVTVTGAPVGPVIATPTPPTAPPTLGGPAVTG